MNDPRDMMAAYAEGTLNAEQVAELEAWLREDMQRARALVREAMLECHLGELLREQNLQDVAVSLSDDSQFGTLHQSPMTSNVTPDNQALPPIHLESHGTLSRQQYLSALSYIARHTFTPKRVAWLATAAALMLGLVLAVVMLTGPDDTAPIADNNTPLKPAESAQPSLRDQAVATITAEYDAVWAEGALAPGSPLRAGQRLTLIRGFAEITTARGAIAILEAPATVELLDNNNALRLHTGKLVGICKTESSKGFLVRTPHVDVIDVGTEFGVELARRDQGTKVHVFSGEVRVETNRDHVESIQLFAKQAVRAGASKIEAIAYEPARFERDIQLVQLRPRFEGGQTHWLGRPPLDLRVDRETSDALQVYLEHDRLHLDQPLVIDADRQAPWPPDQLASRRVSAGQTVDVYLLHLDPPGEQGFWGREYILHFDRPILGIIGAHSSLRATDWVVGVQGVRYPQIEPGMTAKFELGLGLDYPQGNGPVDQCELINNGQSLKLHLTSVQNIDQVRVIVASRGTEPLASHNFTNP